ncbi:general secretion pathway protein H [Yersinia aldovae]|uniref:Type II secretion system protein H n=1 Tax=Yersinia aldovae TaxID=29483 RepID=A0A0T9UWN8_YERAL|nr:type II secretion system minor pseudopilin GspH [Yersinia aldovae]CNK23902.1 general secretion pathway protein H [Yersinia aldovae]CNL78537.1 general secretion pathway protein H [Yersinia aldovae]CNL78987.1 general secretion pathway protein H [Yersinia aldovae]
MRSIKTKRGFTLLEIMLVLVLLGGMAKLVLATLPSSSEINQESEQLAVALQWAAQQAEQDGKVYGLSISHDKWQLMTLNNQPHSKGESYLWPHHYWHPLDDGKLKQQHPLPGGLTLELTLQDQPIPLSTILDDGLINEPKIIFFPGGERSLFELTLSEQDGQTRRITEQGVLPDTETSRSTTLSYNEPQGT